VRTEDLLVAKEKSIQPSLIGEPDIETRERNRPRGSSFWFRCFSQLLAINEARHNPDQLKLEFDKTELLIKEKEQKDEQRRLQRGSSGDS
jgi:hypothetical protein